MSMVQAKRWLDDWARDARSKLGLTFSEVREVLHHEIIDLERQERFPWLRPEGQEAKKED